MKIRIERDIEFCRTGIGWNSGQGPVTERALKLDAYVPAGETGRRLPALIMAFGGAFHRGSKDNDSFSDGHGTSTAVAEYCRMFAERGMAAFAVEYRLAQSDPVPGTRVLSEPDAVPMSRINPVRTEMGLPPIEPRRMAEIMEAAFDDVASAVAFVKAHAVRFGVDAARIVLGGFSAGGRCAMYAAYGKGVKVAGVVSISGPLVPVDARAFLARGGALPPLLMISGERDLDYVVRFMPKLDRIFRDGKRSVEWAMVPGATHFYAAETPTADGRTVIASIADAIGRWV